MKQTDMVCIVCPMGCRINVKEDKDSERGYSVSGNKCPRGVEYGIKELTNPTRVLTSTVKIRGAHLNRLPVRTDKPLEKNRVFDCMKMLDKLEVTAPIKVGDIILENVFETGVNIIASRNM